MDTIDSQRIKHREIPKLKKTNRNLEIHKMYLIAIQFMGIFGGRDDGNQDPMRTEAKKLLFWSKELLGLFFLHA